MQVGTIMYYIKNAVQVNFYRRVITSAHLFHLFPIIWLYLKYIIMSNALHCNYQIHCIYVPYSIIIGISQTKYQLTGIIFYKNMYKYKICKIKKTKHFFFLLDSFILHIIYRFIMLYVGVFKWITFEPIGYNNKLIIITLYYIYTYTISSVHIIL